jgi:putative hydrolase of the HAD superfamily
MRDLNTVIFDLGGVLIHSTQEESVRRFAQLGVGPDKMPLDKYAQRGLIGDLEHGLISAEDFRQGLSNLAGRDITLDECRWAITGYVGGVPQRGLHTILHLRGLGYRCLLLSNTNPFMMSWALSTDYDGNGHSLSYYLDECYCSYQIGEMKPSPAIFQYVIDKESISPDQAIFVDDSPANILAAQQVGLRTLLAVNGEDWTDSLLDSLGEEKVIPTL